MWAVVVAAGAGERFGGAKQFAALGGRRVVDWSVAAAADACDGVVVVLPPGTGEAPDPVGSPGPTSPPTTTVTGGATRSASVRAGLALVPDDAHVVVVHDAARPLAQPALFEAVIAAVRSGADGAVPGVRPADTIKRAPGSAVVDTLDRSQLVAVQTPQAFLASALRGAHRGDPDATDDAALVEAAGGRVEVVAGDPRNLKVTTPDDLALARTLLGGRAPAPAARVGMGFDVHPFSDDPGRALVLGGVTLPGSGAWPVTATPTWSPTPWPTPCWVAHAWATWGHTSPTATSAGGTPTAWPCWPGWWAWSGRRGCGRPTSTARWCWRPRAWRPTGSSWSAGWPPRWVRP